MGKGDMERALRVEAECAATLAGGGGEFLRTLQQPPWMLRQENKSAAQQLGGSFTYKVWADSASIHAVSTPIQTPKPIRRGCWLPP